MPGKLTPALVEDLRTVLQEMREALAEMPRGGLTVKQWCEKYNTNVPTFYKEVASGRLRAIKIGGKTLVLHSDGLAYERALRPLKLSRPT
jgi:excisionase family DNA binding protein